MLICCSLATVRTSCLYVDINPPFMAKRANIYIVNLVPRVRVTLDQRSGTRDSGIKRLPENKNPVIGQTAQASGIRTSGVIKWSHYSTRQFPASRGPFSFVFAELTDGTKRDLCHGSKLSLIQPPSTTMDGGFRNACSLYCLLTVT